MLKVYGKLTQILQEEGVDPLEEIDPYPGDDDEVKEVEEVDPLADPLGGCSPPREVEEGPVSPPRADADGTASSNLGAWILGMHV